MLNLEREDARIVEHLTGAVSEIAAVRHAGSSRRHAARREATLRELCRYIEARRFPRNPRRAGGAIPVFVDASERRCAVAHLLEKTAGRDLVERVARDANHARVRELARDPELTLWLAWTGISAREAARIQPSYGPELVSGCICGGGGMHGLRTESVDATATLIPMSASLANTMTRTAGRPISDAPSFCVARIDEALTAGTPAVGTEVVVEFCTVKTGRVLLHIEEKSEFARRFAVRDESGGYDAGTNPPVLLATIEESIDASGVLTTSCTQAPEGSIPLAVYLEARAVPERCREFLMARNPGWGGILGPAHPGQANPSDAPFSPWTSAAWVPIAGGSVLLIVVVGGAWWFRRRHRGA